MMNEAVVENGPSGSPAAGAYLVFVLLCTGATLLLDGIFVGLIPGRVYGMINPLLWLSSFLGIPGWELVGPIGAILEWPVNLIPEWIGYCYALFAIPLWILYVAMLRGILGQRIFGILFPFLIVSVGFTAQKALLYRADGNRRAGNNVRFERYRDKVQYLEADVLCERGMLYAIRLTGGDVDRQRLAGLGFAESFPATNETDSSGRSQIRSDVQANAGAGIFPEESSPAVTDIPCTRPQVPPASAAAFSATVVPQQPTRQPPAPKTKHASTKSGYAIEYGLEWQPTPAAVRVQSGPMGEADIFLRHSDGVTNFWIVADRHPLGHTTLNPRTTAAWELATLSYPGCVKVSSEDFTLSDEPARRLAYRVREQGVEMDFISVLMIKGPIMYVLFGASPIPSKGASGLDAKFDELLAAFVLE